MNNGTIVCKRTLTKANEVLEPVSLSLFPSVHHSSVFAINKQPSTIHSLLRHLLFSHSSLACQAAASRHAVASREGWLAKVGHSSPEFRRALRVRARRGESGDE